jgi:hypothetical protein
VGDGVACVGDGLGVGLGVGVDVGVVDGLGVGVGLECSVQVCRDWPAEAVLAAVEPVFAEPVVAGSAVVEWASAAPVLPSPAPVAGPLVAAWPAPMPCVRPAGVGVGVGAGVGADDTSGGCFRP